MQIRILGLQGATSIDAVRVATAKMSTADTVAALAKTKLTAAEQIQILKEKGLSVDRATLIASTNTMSSADLYAALTKTNLANSITAESLATSGLTAEQIAAAVATSNLSASVLAQLLATTSLAKEQQIEILMHKGLSKAQAEEAVAKAASTAATTSATAATGLFTSATVVAKGAVKGLTAALAANPWLLAIAAIIGVVAAFNKLSTAAVDASEKSKEAAEAAIEITKEHEAEQEQIDQLIKKYQELASQEFIDADTRIEIRDIQKEINSLVSGEVDGLDLVNGKLDDQILKLKQLQLEEVKTQQSDFVAAYSEAKKSYNNAYVRDVEDSGWASWASSWGGIELTVDGWDEEAAKIINSIEGASAEWDSNFVTTLTSIEFDTGTAQEYYDILTKCIEAMESDANFNHYDNAVYNKLVKNRKEYSAIIDTLDEATASMANRAITEERLNLDISGMVVDSVDSYLAYQQKLIDNLAANEDIKQLLLDGTATSDNVQTLIDNMMATQFPTYYNELNKQIEESTSGIDTLTKVINSYQNTIGKLKSATDEYNNTGSVSVETYNELIKLNKDYANLFDFSSGKIAIAADEVDRLVDELIAEYGATLAANGATEAQIAQMVALANSLSNVKDKIRDLEWKKFDDVQEEIKKITDESEFLLNLLDNRDMVDDNGKLTEYGNAAMGLHGVNYNVYMEQAQRYADELAKIESDLANDPANQTLIDRKEELLELQRESVLAAEDEKQAMIDLVKEGIEAELDALDNLINKYKDALDATKDLYDYRNKVSDITEEIGTLQKQIIAYENDTSEEAKAQIQKLKVDLEEAQEELQKTEYDQFIADQKKLLDNLYDDYESILNRRLDNVGTLIKDSITAINTNASDIKETLEAAVGSVDTTLSDKMDAIWTVVDECKTVVSDYSTNNDTISSGVTTIENTLSIIVSALEALVNAGNESNSTGSSDSGSTPSGSGTTESKVPSNPGGINIPKFESTLKRTGTLNSQDYSVSGLNDASVGWDDCEVKIDGQTFKVATYDSEDNTVSDTTERKLNDLFGGTKPPAKTLAGLDGVVYVVSTDGGWVNFADKNKRSEMTTAFFNKLNSYNEGGLADFTGLAWMDGTKTKPEMVLDSEDTQNFIALRDILAQLASDNVSFGNPLYSSFAPMSYGNNIPNFGEKLAQILTNYGETNVENHFEITIPIEKVEDYNDFVTKLQKDGKFEKMIQAMTIGRINGGSPLDKYKYQWTK